ncbi:hypothetical protein EC991_010208 [Linnemannia zychae]|nr:hypothetical protein EC991_010208 [Linnemannia zychae]
MPLYNGEAFSVATIALLFIHFFLLCIWVGVSGAFISKHPDVPRELPGMEFGKAFVAWFGYGLQLCIADSSATVRIIVNGPLAATVLGLYAVYIARGTTLGVGELCHSNMGMCFFDHLVTFVALLIVTVIILDFVLSANWVDKLRSLRLPRIRLVPVRKSRPAPVPTLPVSKPESEQEKKLSELDRRSTMSSVTTLQGDGVHTEKEKEEKRHSVITIDATDEYEFDQFLEQIVPNPTSDNPGSMPNKEL